MNAPGLILTVVLAAGIAGAGIAGFAVLSGDGGDGEVSITYVLDGGTNDPSNPDSFGGDALVLADPSREHYTFAGWYSDASMTQRVTEVDGSGGDVTLYAKWAIVPYTITYVTGCADASNPNPGRFSSDTLALQDAERPHYDFGGWFAEDTFENRVTELERTGDTTVYAKWTMIRYPITYVMGCGDCINPNPASFGSDTVVLQDPEREHYTFAGWYTEGTFENRVTELKRTGDTTVYAKWTMIRYPITYVMGCNDAANGNPDSFPSDVLTLEGATRPHYTFGGWYAEDTFENKVTELARDGEKTVYAKWTMIRYPITYVMGCDVYTNPNPSNFQTDTVILADPEREHYAFSGWYTESTFDNRVTELARDGEKTVYAKWTLTAYTITYVTGGYCVNPNPVSGTIEDTLTITDAFAPYMTFAGWYTSGTFEPATRVGSTITPYSDTTLYAKWEDTVGSLVTYSMIGSYDDISMYGAMSVGRCAYDGSHYLTMTYGKIIAELGNGYFDTYSFDSSWDTSDGGSDTEYLGTETIDTALGQVTAHKFGHTDGSAAWFGADGYMYRSVEGGLTLEIFSIESFEPGTGEQTVTVIKGTGIASVTGAGTYTVGDHVTLTATVGEGYEFGGYSLDGLFLFSDEPVLEFDIAGSMEIYVLAKDWYMTVPDDGWTEHSWTVVDDAAGSTVVETDVPYTSFHLDQYRSYTLTAAYTEDGERQSDRTDLIPGLAFARNCSFTFNGSRSVTSAGYLTEYRYYKNLDTGGRDPPEYTDALFRRYAVTGDETIRLLANVLMEQSEGMSEVDRVNFILRYVQSCIEYEYDTDAKGAEEYWKYPCETLYEGRGDCEDSALLFASIMKCMGYDTAILIFPSHAAVGISGVEGSSGTGFESGGRTYLYCETTATGWTLGRIPDDMKSETPGVFVL